MSDRRRWSGLFVLIGLVLLGLQWNATGQHVAATVVGGCLLFAGLVGFLTSLDR